MKKLKMAFSFEITAMTALLTVMCLYLQPLHAAEERIFGKWVVPGGDAVVSIVGDNSSANLILLQLLDADVADENNPDASLRARPLRGIMLGENFQSSGDTWRGGSLYDPDTGNTYRATLRIIDENHIAVRGFVGLSLLGRSQTWTRFDYFAPLMKNMLALSEESIDDK